MKYRVGVIGLRGIGHVHIEALKQLEQVEIVAVCSRSDVETYANTHHILKYFTHYQAMIDEVDLDAVHICTGNDTHYEIAKYALEKGLHVVLEKPMTLNVDEASELLKIALQKDLVHAIHFHNRFYPANYYLNSNIHKIGDIFSIHGMYIQDWMLPKERYNWRTQKSVSGLTRVVGDIGSHWLDLIEYVSGHRIVEVMAAFKRIYDERGGHVIDTEDIASIMFKTDNGALGTVFVSQSVGGAKNRVQTIYSGQLAAFEWQGDFLDKVVIGFTDQENQVMTIDTMDTLHDHNVYQVTDFVSSFRETFRQFYHKIGNRDFKENFARFKDGLHSMKVIEAIYQSAQQKKWVNVND